MQTRNRKSRNKKEAGKGLSMGSSDDDSDDSAVNRRRNNSISRLYDDGEKVLAYHGPRIYEAKVYMYFFFFHLNLFHLFNF